MKVVINTGPLIFLSKINRIPILRKFGNIYVPKEVISEISYKKEIATRTAIKASKDWLKIKIVRDKNLLAVLTKELDGGEAGVICVALEQKADWVILDDQDARRFAHRYGLKVIGTLGLLAWAKKNGFIKSLRTEIEMLQETGFYAIQALTERLLEEVGKGAER